MSTSHPPDVIHMISVPKPSQFFTALLGLSVSYTKCKLKNKKVGWPGNNISILKISL